MRYDIFDGNAAKWRAAEKWVDDNRFLQAPPCGFPPKELPSADVSREMIRQVRAGFKEFSREEWKRERDREQERQRQERRRPDRGWGMER